MNKLILGAASLTIASAIVANAAITSVGPATTDLPAGPGTTAPPWTLELPFAVDLTASGSTVTWSGSGNWSVKLTDGSFGPTKIVQVEAYHLVGPRPGESAPGATFYGLAGFMAVAGAKGTSTATLAHGGHTDLWDLVVAVDPGATTASGTLRAFHAAPFNSVPEPSSFALAAGLGLLGFAAYRRARG